MNQQYYKFATEEEITQAYLNGLQSVIRLFITQAEMLVSLILIYDERIESIESKEATLKQQILEFEQKYEQLFNNSLNTQADNDYSEDGSQRKSD